MSLGKWKVLVSIASFSLLLAACSDDNSDVSGEIDDPEEHEEHEESPETGVVEDMRLKAETPSASPQLALDREILSLLVCRSPEAYSPRILIRAAMTAMYSQSCSRL